MIKTASEKEPFKVSFTNGKIVSVSDNTPEKGGHGDGFRPHDMLEAALACCMNMSVRMYAQEHSLPVENVATTVELDRSEPGRACFRYSVEMGGPLSEDDKQEILEMLKNCPVRRTLSGEIAFAEKKRSSEDCAKY